MQSISTVSVFHLPKVSENISSNSVSNPSTRYFSEFFFSGTGHNLFNIFPFVFDVYNIDDSFIIILSGSMLCGLHQQLSRIELV